jgi:plastocyanin
VALALWISAVLPAAAPATIQGQVSGAEGALRSGRVVWIEEIPGEFPPPKAHSVMDQKDLRFVPHVLAILVGTVVDFPNSDPLLHNVFSVSQAKRFNLGLYAKGHAASVVFDKPGVVPILCSVHPEMSAYIVVLRTPFFAVTGPDGRFAIRNVPPGAHTVHCWSEDGRTEQRAVTVQPGGVETIAF